MIQYVCEHFDKFIILRISNENVNFIIFNFLGKRSDIENRLYILYWTVTCIRIRYDLHRKCYLTLKPTIFTEISHFQKAMLN